MAAPETFAEARSREAEARGDQAKAAFWRRIKARVDEAPELTPEQIAQLRVLLAPVASAASAA